MISSKTARFWAQYATSDPANFPRYVGRRVHERFGTPPAGDTIISVGRVRLPLDMSVHVLMAKYYFRTHEMFLERVFRRHLRPGQSFIDVGANFGYWSAVAANLVGPHGAVHMFEPVGRYYASLEKFSALNPEYTLLASNVAVGAAPGTATMDVVNIDSTNFANYNVNTGSNSMLDGFLGASLDLVTKIDVPVIRLDNYVADQRIKPSSIGLIKIDVEGFESFVLDGMPDLLSATPRVPILVEVITAPERNPLLDGPKVVERMSQLGYTCLNATTLRPIDPGRMHLEENLVCV